jgi:oxidoreductase family protein
VASSAGDGDASDPMPRPPPRPDPEDCCNGGCVRCVFDMYEDAREAYEAALRAWRERHPQADRSGSDSCSS